VGVWLGYVRNCTVANNEIKDLPYSGISLGWGWGFADTPVGNNRIKNNHIHDHVKSMVDAGAIYSLGAQPGTVFSGNVIENQTNEYGAIYLDQGSRHITIYNNVVYNNKRTLLLHLSGDNYVYSNWWQVRPDNNFTSCTDLCEINDPYTYSHLGPNGIDANHVINSMAEAPASIIQNAGMSDDYDDIVPVCSPGTTGGGCMACDEYGSGWTDDDSLCSAGESCVNGNCRASTTSSTSTTSTTLPCTMLGNYPDEYGSCDEVTLSEIINAINLWASDQFELGEVIDLINSWANPLIYPPN
jgi:hypothetical protein